MTTIAANPPSPIRNIRLGQQAMLGLLILVEIVHTVVLSLRSHRLVAQPFIIVGLVAVIRKILFVLSSEKLPSASVLALLLAMVAVFILGLIAVNRFGGGEEPDSAGL